MSDYAQGQRKNRTRRPVQSGARLMAHRRFGRIRGQVDDADRTNELESIFDVEFYSRQLVDAPAFTSVAQAVEHYRRVGQWNLLSPHPLFDAAYYRFLYSDLSEVDDLFSHYCSQGQSEGRRPHALFDPDEYVSRHRDVCGSPSLAAPFTHFLECAQFTSPTRMWMPPQAPETHRLEPGGSGFDDRAVFLDYLASRLPRDFIPHYLFDPSWFERYSADVGEVATPLVHYASRSRDDRTRVRAHPLIDEAWYLEQFGQRMHWWESVLDHYLKSLDTSPHPAINLDAYHRATGRLFHATQLSRPYATTLGSENPSGVSILIINIDALPATIACVEALRDDVGVLAHEVLVLDNGSSDACEASRLRQFLPGVQVLSSRQRYSFGEANNLLAERASGRYLLLLNNDAFATPSVIERLVVDLQDDRQIVGMGPLFVYPDGVIQEAGGRVVEDGSPIQLGKGQRTLIPSLAGMRDVDYVSAACAIIRREAFDAVGGFSLVYEPAYFEDTDLFRRLRMLGRVVVDTTLVVPHLEGYSTGKETVLDDKAAVIAAAKLKWTTRFQTEAQLPPIAHRPRGTQSSKSALLYSPYGLQIGGGERYFLSMANALSLESHVTLLHPSEYSSHRLRHVQAELGLPANALSMAEAPWTGMSPDIFVAMGNHMRPPVRACGAVNLYHIQFPFDDVSDQEVSTRSLLSEYDGIVVNSAFTRRHVSAKLHSLGLSIPVAVVSPPCGNAKWGPPSSQRPQQIVSVGRFFGDGHTKQHLGMAIAAGRLAASLPGVRLTLAGAVAPTREDLKYLSDLQASLGTAPVDLLVNPSRDQLLGALNSASLYWHAAGLGVADSRPEKMEHFGIALVEAVLNGAVPVAMGAGGPREILEGEPELQFATIEELIEKSRSLLSAPHVMDEIQERLHGFEQYSDEAFHHRFLALVSSLKTVEPSSPSRPEASNVGP